MEKQFHRKETADLPCPIFEDRQEAGRALAQRLFHYRRNQGLLVVALSPGGVIVGKEIASSLEVPMIPFRSLRLPIPGHPEMAFGAMTEGGTICLLSDMISRYEIPDRYIQETITSKKEEILRRRRRFRKTSVGFDLRGRKVILVDEGIAGGAVLFSALQWLRGEGVGRRIVALPVIPLEKRSRINERSEESVILYVVPSIRSVGDYYQQFDPISDETARAILSCINKRKGAA